MPDSLLARLGVQTKIRLVLSDLTSLERWLTVNLKKIVGFLAIAFVLFLVISQPAGSAAIIQNILGVLRNAAESVATFLSTLF